jgi:hypothetical protein
LGRLCDPPEDIIGREGPNAWEHDSVVLPLYFSEVHPPGGLLDVVPDDELCRGHLLLGDDGALARFNAAVGDREPKPTFFALFEALNWAVAIETSSASSGGRRRLARGSTGGIEWRAARSSTACVAAQQLPSGLVQALAVLLAPLRAFVVGQSPTRRVGHDGHLQSSRGAIAARFGCRRRWCRARSPRRVGER